MTVGSTSVQTTGATGSGTTGPFSFSIRLQAHGDATAASQLEVIKTLISTGAESTLSYPADFSLALNNDQDASPGGSITTTDAVTSAYKIYIRRSPSYLQPVDLTPQGPYSATTIEGAFDQAAFWAQDLLDRMKGAPHFGVQKGSSFDGRVRSAPLPGYLLQVNDAGTGYEQVANNGSSNLVTATGSTTARTLADWMAGFLGATAFTSGDATPSVLNGRNFVTAGSTTITTFDDGVENQLITIYRGASDITIADGATVETLLNANITLTIWQPSVTFRLSSGVWKQVYDLALVRTRARSGGLFDYEVSIGPDNGTDFPVWSVDGGSSRSVMRARSILLGDPGDTVDVCGRYVAGTAASPTTPTGFQPTFTVWSRAPLVTLSPPVDNTTYNTGRHWQLYGGQYQTPTSSASGGWMGLGVCANDELATWLRMWANGGNTDGVGFVFPGRSNVPGQEARESDGGSLISAPYTFSDVKNIFSAGVVNPKDILAKGNIHLIASDNSVNFSAIAIRFSDALTYGFDFSTDHTNDTLILYPVASASRGSNAIEFDNDGNIRPLVDGGSDVGTSALKFGLGYFKQASIVPTADANPLHVHAANASFTSDVLLLQSTRAASSAFNFINVSADVGGTPSTIFTLSGAGVAYLSGSLELGHLTDTTIARVAAGAITVEGLGVWRVLASAFTSAHTGDTSETTLATVTIPAGAMGPNGQIRIISQWHFTSGGAPNTRNFYIYFNGTGGTKYLDAASASTVHSNRQFTSVRNLNSASSQSGGAAAAMAGTGGWSNNANAGATSSVDTTAAVDVVFRGKLDNSGDSVSVSYTVEILYGA